VAGEFPSEGVKMGISPVAGVRGVALLKPPKNASFVPPALAVDASGRARDDTYGDSREALARELEEEDRGLDSDSEAGAGEGAESAPVDADSRVNLFA
jgi:hypothetical protein